MQGYKIEFSVFAESQQEADAVSKAFGQFVDGLAHEGIAVSANKLLSIISKWGSNPMIKNYFNGKKM